MRIAILGARGQLGREVERAAWAAGMIVNPYSRAGCDITDAGQAEEMLAIGPPAVVVNCAAFHNVDDCEREPRTAWTVNAFAVGHLADACAHRGAKLVHISTNYVFDGEHGPPFRESHATRPLQVYGWSKLHGEMGIQLHCPDHLIIRTGALYGHGGASGKGGGFLPAMLKLAAAGESPEIVGDQLVSPTYARDVAETIIRLLQLETCGIVHVTNSGEASWCEFASAIFRSVGAKGCPVPVTTAQKAASSPTPYTPRPLYGVMASDVLPSLGIAMRPWQEALAAFLREEAHA